MRTLFILGASLFLLLVVIPALVGLLFRAPECPNCGSLDIQKIPARVGHGKRRSCNPCGWLFLFLLMATSAFAGDRSLTVLGGWEHTPNSNYGDGADIDARLESPLYGDLNAALEASYHSPMTHIKYGDLSGYSALGEIVYRPSSTWKLKPYAFGGAGWSWWNFDRNEDMVSKDIVINVGDAFAQKYGVGASYDLGSGWSLVVEWSYFRTDVPKDSYYGASGAFANVAGGSTIGEEETNLSVGFRRSF